MLPPSGAILAGQYVGNEYRPAVGIFCGGDSRLRQPTSLAFDGQGYLYVTSFIAMVRTILAASNPHQFGQLIN